MGKRAFSPPAECSICLQRPVLGETLINVEEYWICVDCFSKDTPGSDVTTKSTFHALESVRHDCTVKHNTVADKSVALDPQVDCITERVATWHHHAAQSIRDYGNRKNKAALIQHGEAVPKEAGRLHNTMADPDLVSMESSEARGRLLHDNDVVALGLDVSNTVRAENTAEKLIAHEIALAHKIAMEQAKKSQFDLDPTIQLKRLRESARMMTVVQQGVMNLQKLKSGGAQNVVVQHVHVASGGQAVVGNVKHEVT